MQCLLHNNNYSDVISPGSLARDLLIFDSIILSRTSILLKWQLHVLQELSPWAEVPAGKRSSKLAAKRAMKNIVESVAIVVVCRGYNHADCSDFSGQACFYNNYYSQDSCKLTTAFGWSRTFYL